MSKIKKLPEQRTEFQAAVLEIDRGRRISALKFAAVMVLLVTAVFGVMGLTYTLHELAFYAVQSFTGEF